MTSGPPLQSPVLCRGPWGGLVMWSHGDPRSPPLSPRPFDCAQDELRGAPVPPGLSQIPGGKWVGGPSIALTPHGNLQVSQQHSRGLLPAANAERPSAFAIDHIGPQPQAQHRDTQHNCQTTPRPIACPEPGQERARGGQPEVQPRDRPMAIPCDDQALVEMGAVAAKTFSRWRRRRRKVNAASKMKGQTSTRRPRPTGGCAAPR